MAVTLSQFKDYVGTKDASDFPQLCLTAGHQLVTNKVAGASVPAAVHDQAVLMVASEIFHRRSAPNGITQFADFGGQAVRLGKDPLSPAYALLMPYIGFAV